MNKYKYLMLVTNAVLMLIIVDFTLYTISLKNNGFGLGSGF